MSSSSFKGDSATTGDGSTDGVKMTKPHRCNARLEDFIQAMFTLNFQNAIRPAWKNFRECMASEPGKEPQGEYIVLEDPEKYLKPMQRSSKK